MIGAGKSADRGAIASNGLVSGRYTWLLMALGLYLTTFTAFTLPWLRHIDSAIPSYPFPLDADLIIWTLSWVAHALVDPEARVFDANIYHPAPAQLTGSEHWFVPQLLFAPLYLLTGRPVLATGIVTFVTYPLGAFAMSALLTRMGCSRVVAWLCGLAYAVGILRVPLNFHTLQYPNLYLPLVALGAIQVRRIPGWKSYCSLFLILLAALLTSFYIGAIVCVALALWVLGEVVVARQKSGAFMTAVVLSLVAAIIVAGLVLSPYTARSEAMVPDSLPWDRGNKFLGYSRFAFAYWRINADAWRIAFAPLALLSLGGGMEADLRRLAIIGGILGLLSAVLVFIGLPEGLGQLVAHTPLRNLRVWVRLFLVTDFGLCLLAAAGLDSCRRRFGMRFAVAPIAAFALLATLPRLTSLVSGVTRSPPALNERAGAYRTVKRHVDALGRGPLLELPTGFQFDCEAMLGSTVHWLPLLNGFTGYAPPHSRALRAATNALPDQGALQDLVDLSHLSWILVRPDQDWANAEQAARMRQGLSRSELIARTLTFDGFTLYQVKANPLRPQWYAAIAAGPSPGTTALGTPVRMLSPAEAVAVVEPTKKLPERALLGLIPLRLRVQNAGSADWPVLVGPEVGSAIKPLLHPFTVYLEAKWTMASELAASQGGRDLVFNMVLDRDVAAQDTVVQTFKVPTPAVPGRYRLDIRIVQKDGPAFAEPPSRMLHTMLDLKSWAARPAPTPQFDQF